MGFATATGAHYCGRTVRSYRHLFTLTRQGYPRQAVLFSVALSVKLALSEPPRPLAGMLPYGDRTFLPARIMGFSTISAGELTHSADPNLL